MEKETKKGREGERDNRREGNNVEKIGEKKS